MSDRRYLLSSDTIVLYTHTAPSLHLTNDVLSATPVSLPVLMHFFISIFLLQFSGFVFSCVARNVHCFFGYRVPCCWTCSWCIIMLDKASTRPVNLMGTQCRLWNVHARPLYRWPIRCMKAIALFASLVRWLARFTTKYTRLLFFFFWGVRK